jgi:hypothetical protein
MEYRRVKNNRLWITWWSGKKAAKKEKNLLLHRASREKRNDLMILCRVQSEAEAPSDVISLYMAPRLNDHGLNKVYRSL